MRYSLDSLTDGPLIKAAQPIPNKEIIDFWDSLDINLEDAAFNYDIIPQFKKNYAFWIKESKKNNLHGLERYSHLSLSHGTSEAFHIFWAKNPRSRKSQTFLNMQISSSRSFHKYLTNMGR